MSGTGARISELVPAALPLAGTEEVALRAGSGNARVTIEEILWAARLVSVSQRADNTTTGGNARGPNAVDLQTTRTLASQVASGASAVLAGGQNCTASGAQSVVGGGSANVASGSVAAVAGGSANVADAQGAWVPGGIRALARGHHGRGAWSAGMFAASGDAQCSEFVIRAQTTDATPTRLTATGGAPSTINTLSLPNNATYRLKLIVVAQQTGGTAGTSGDCASWEADVLIRRGANAAATVFVGGRTVNTTPAHASVNAGVAFTAGMRDAAAAAWTLTLAADTTNGGLAVTGTGEANKTIRWVARVLSVEVTA